MTTLQNIFAGGTNGVAVSPANSGGTSGDAFQDVITSAGAVAFSNAQGNRSSLAAAISGTGSGTSYMQWTSAQFTTASATWRDRIDLFFTGNPSTTVGFYWVGNGSTRGVAASVNTSGLIEVRNAAASGGALVTTFTNPIPVNAWARVEVRGVASSTTGEIHMALYAGDSTTPIESKDFTAQNTGTALINTRRYGRHTGQTYNGTYYIGGIKADDSAATTYIGPPAATPPTVVVNGADTYRINASGSTGASKTYNIAQTDGPAATPEYLGGGKWDVARSADADRVYDVTVTDNGLSSTLSFTVPKVAAVASGARILRRRMVGGVLQ